MILSDTQFLEYLNTFRLEAEIIKRQLYAVPTTILDGRPALFDEYAFYLPYQIDKCTFNVKQIHNTELVRDVVISRSKELIYVVESILRYRRNQVKPETLILLGPAFKSLSKFRAALEKKYPGVDF